MKPISLTERRLRQEEERLAAKILQLLSILSGVAGAALLAKREPWGVVPLAFAGFTAIPFVRRIAERLVKPQ